MTITLTREEAQQVLDALEEGLTSKEYRALVETLRARLSAPEPEPVRLRRGDILRCIETNELCTVWATSTTGKTQVKWKANDFGSYTAEQIGDLFWVEPKPEPEPVVWRTRRNDTWSYHHNKPHGIPHEPLYTTTPQSEPPCKTGSQCIGGKCPQCVVSEPEPVAWMQNDMEHFSLWPDEWHVVPLYTTPPQREWQGLTDAEVTACWKDGFDSCEQKTVADLRDFIARAIEAKLKEKNNDLP